MRLCNFLPVLMVYIVNITSVLCQNKTRAQDVFLGQKLVGLMSQVRQKMCSVFCCFQQRRKKENQTHFSDDTTILIQQVYHD